MVVLGESSESVVFDEASEFQIILHFIAPLSQHPFVVPCVCWIRVDVFHDHPQILGDSLRR